MSKKNQDGTSAEQDFRARCQAYLAARWESITSGYGAAEPPPDPLHDRPDLVERMRSSLTSKSKSYHYVLPTHLLAKCVNPGLDVHSIQVSFGAAGAFDARSLAHGVIVPFDQANFCVLGGAPEPYANNPLRIPAVTPAYASAQKWQADWANLVAVFDEVETTADARFTARVFDQVLLEIYRLLARAKVAYPTPSRVSLQTTYELIQGFMAERSGGDRMEVLAAALFQTIGERFQLFDEVRRAKVNAADRSSGMSADIECWADGSVALLVEVKDRALTLVQLTTKLDRARAEHITEILFIAQQGKSLGEETAIDARMSQEFVSGQNIYVADFAAFALGIFILLGEEGRVDFLRRVGPELDRGGSAIEHRRRWAELLRGA